LDRFTLRLQDTANIGTRKRTRGSCETMMSNNNSETLFARAERAVAKFKKDKIFSNMRMFIEDGVLRSVVWQMNAPTKRVEERK